MRIVLTFLKQRWKKNPTNLSFVVKDSVEEQGIFRMTYRRAIPTFLSSTESRHLQTCNSECRIMQDSALQWCCHCKLYQADARLVYVVVQAQQAQQVGYM